uniref:NADH dehydrogenase subunit 2 n=1 Tax=Otobius lagophilus TaxID=2944767 RepID=UPI0022375D2F|nr:NADH dehydrogenase subunit 2 [Otobius lagophilus]UYB78379.1 NADH dehydrogenase subunit 2 [Otobius lagophilus]UYB78392.1 NADH dehydrogenase subunit 2 [Otobius lagophilus]UYL27132.1 NADH dehydrogenase subunit 2 [Otobius lagophilus]
MTTFILFWTLITSIILAISTSSMFSLWICLEVNMMMFIPLMNSKNSLSSNSMMLYFIVQSLASSIFIFSFFLLTIFPNLNHFMIFFMMSSILIKLGAAPFHIWFPQISEGLSFPSFTILILIQKIIPLYILTFLNNIFVMTTIILSSIIGSLGGWNQNSLRKIIAFSSISHLAWMISIMISKSNWWLIYFFTYSFIILSLLLILYLNNLSFISQIIKLTNPLQKTMLIISLMSLGGMPPLLGFFMKWMSIKIISSFFPLILIFLIPSSLFNLFFYSRVLYPLFLKIMIKNHNPTKSKIPFTLMISSQCLTLFFLIPLS